MKKFRFFAAISAAIVALSSVGCSKFEEDVFEEPSAIRLEDTNNEVKKILTSGTGEWIFEAYPGKGQKYGGYTYTLKFTEEEVTAWFEFAPGESITSRYKMTKDNGPVISFDTYNEFLHYFATPSSSLYQAYGGDFEFTVLEYGNDALTLLGKRSGNHCFLRRVDAEVVAADYVAAVQELEDNFLVSMLDGKIGDLDVTGSVDIDNRRVYLNYLGPDGDDEDTDPDEEEVSVAFAFTDYGIRFYEPIQINGYTMDRMWFLAENKLLTNGVVTLQGKLPEDYVDYYDFAGDYVLTYNNTRKVNVTLTPEDGGYRMSGISDKFTVFLTYDKGLGRLRWNSQKVGENGNNVVYLCAWALGSGGSLTWDEAAGVTIHWVEENGQFEFEDNGAWEGKATDSFILWELDANLKSVGQFTGWGSPQYAHLSSLKRR